MGCGPSSAETSNVDASKGELLVLTGKGVLSDSSHNSIDIKILSF